MRGVVYRDFANFWTCSDMVLTICGAGFVSVLIRQVLGVGGLFFGVGVMVNVSSGIFVYKRGEFVRRVVDVQGVNSCSCCSNFYPVWSNA